LFRREGAQALAWAAALAADTEREPILAELVCLAGRESPELAMPWYEHFRGSLGRGWADRFASEAIIGATGRGAEDLIRLWEMFKGEFVGVGFPQGSFAEGFDFHRLLTALPQASGNFRVVSYWAGLDRDAAWAGVKELIDSQGVGAGYFGSLVLGVAAVQGNREAAKWIGAKLADVPAGLRERAIQSFAQYPEMRQAENIKLIFEELPTESDRLTLAKRMISPYSSAAELEVAMDAVGSQAARVAAVVAVAATYQRALKDPTARFVYDIRDFFNSTMDQFQFSAEERAQVNAALTGDPPYAGSAFFAPLPENRLHSLRQGVSLSPAQLIPCASYSPPAVTKTPPARTTR
jgi:hypothetical protein